MVFPAAPLSGLTRELIVEAALDPGPLRSTSTEEEEEEVHMVAILVGGSLLGWMKGELERYGVRYACSGC